MTNLLAKVLNGYRGADTGALTIEDLQRENAHLNANLSRMAGLLAQNRLETDLLRRSAKRQKPTYSWLAERACLDAKGLYALQCTGVQPSRRNAKEILGMGERRWAWARKLALFAGVHDGALFDDLDARTIIQRLEEGRIDAEAHPDAWRKYE